MCRKILLLLTILRFSYCHEHHRENFSLLINFTCAVAKDEHEKHPEMRTIAMIELENNFPSDFSAKVLKCLPQDVAKIIINPNSVTLILPKESMILYIADEMKEGETFDQAKDIFTKNFPVVNHLSKHLIVSTKATKISKLQKEFLNVVQVYEQNGKIIANIFDMTTNLTTIHTFTASDHENLSQILFPDKVKNLNGKLIYAVNTESPEAHGRRGVMKPNCRWNFYLDIIAEKLNATLHYSEIFGNRTSHQAFIQSRADQVKERIKNGTLDFYLNFDHKKFDLESYFALDWCFLAPFPPEYSIADQILFLPLDKSCWMWLGITIAVSTLVWRISEGHWNFLFGAFAFFVGQSAEIRTSRLTMKALLQLLIFTFFIFSNGYQSLVTSFMLQPVRQNLLKTIDEVFDSDLNIEFDRAFDEMHQNNPKYQKALKDNRIGRFNSQHLDWQKEFLEKHFVDSQPCSMTKNTLQHEGSDENWRNLYLVVEPAVTFPEDLFTRPQHPYLEKFQELMDQSFEAGLSIAWERFYFDIANVVRMKPNNLIPADKTILDFYDILPFFTILVVGFVAALLALLCEIFYKDFVSELSRNFFKEKLGKFFRRKIEVKKVKVKEIKVSHRRNSI